MYVLGVHIRIREPGNVLSEGFMLNLTSRQKIRLVDARVLNLCQA
jgi:hypothetical protein